LTIDLDAGVSGRPRAVAQVEIAQRRRGSRYLSTRPNSPIEAFMSPSCFDPMRRLGNRGACRMEGFEFPASCPGFWRNRICNLNCSGSLETNANAAGRHCLEQ
jgi:hypothetical protein